MTLECCDRRDRRDRHGENIGACAPNGIDFIEVDYRKGKIEAHFFDNVCRSDFQFSITDLLTDESKPVTADSVGSSSNTVVFCLRAHRIQLVEGRRYSLAVSRQKDNDGSQMLDPRFSHGEFTYNATVGAEVDFISPETPKQSVFPAPKLNYLAKDYAGFRQLVLDRLAITMPNWQETHAADLGMTLVELLAFVADRISYEQDAVATEAYLSTARRRPSVRRHARLVDYRMHEGCNARAFVHLTVMGNFSIDPRDVLFTPDLPDRLQLPTGPLRFDQIPDEVWGRVLAYEPMQLPPCDWKLTESQIKDNHALEQSYSRFADNEDVNSLTRDQRNLGLLAARGLHELSIGSLSDVNRWLESVDLFEDAGLRKELGSFVSQVGHLAIRHRNRAILDFLLPQFISTAAIVPQLRLCEAHNEIRFYTWCESKCSIPKGATKATLLDCKTPPKDPAESVDCSPSDKKQDLTRILQLNVGDWLLLEEVRGPNTAQTADADPTKRHYVRLTRVTNAFDSLNNNCPIVEIEWGPEDALLFPICISNQLPPPNCRVLTNISVARGNIVLVDHGRTLDYQSLGTQTGKLLQVDCGSDWAKPKIVQQLVPLEPLLRDVEPTYAQPIEACVSAANALRQQPSLAAPAALIMETPAASNGMAVRLSPTVLESDNGLLFETYWQGLTAPERYAIEDLVDADAAYDLSLLTAKKLFPTDDDARQERCRQLLGEIRDRLSWQWRFDLMSSTQTDRHFVVESETNRALHVRFGDDDHGMRPALGSEMFLRLRVGSGSRGNVGAERLKRIVFKRNGGAIFQVRNPLPAQGGTDHESIEQAKLLAPHAYQKDQPRALRADDYQALVMAKFSDRVQSVRASISPRGTYQWVDVAIDPLAAVTDQAALLRDISDFLNTVRKISHLIFVQLQQRVPVDLRLTVFVDPMVPRENVRRSVMDALGNRVQGNGKLAFFHPDRLTFGRPIRSNTIIQWILKLPGVVDAKVTFLGRLGDTAHVTTDKEAWPEFTLQLNSTEIAELDHCGGNDAGRLCLTLEGGR